MMMHAVEFENYCGCCYRYGRCRSCCSWCCCFNSCEQEYSIPQMDDTGRSAGKSYVSSDLKLSVVTLGMLINGGPSIDGLRCIGLGLLLMPPKS